MKAAITYVSSDGTINPLEITGERITTQLHDDGRANVRVFTGGRKTRWLAIRCADLIDVEVDDGPA